MDGNFTPQNITPGNNMDPSLDPRVQKKKLRHRFIAGIVVGCVIACLLIQGALLVFRAFGRKGAGAVIGLGDAGADELLSDQTLDKIQTIEDTIDKYYKDEVDREAEADGIYKGLVDSLGDPYSVYYTEEELEDLLSDTAGVYYGIGAYVSYDDEIGFPRVSGVIPGTPAENAGIISDDIIYEVDGESMAGLELEDVVSRIKGPEGTTVNIVLLRGAKRDEVEVDVQRSAVEVPTVNVKMVGEKENIGYLQITEFDEVTPDQFTEGMAELREKDMQGLIIDLRSNPGGSLAAVCDIAEQLLPKGLIVYTVDKYGNKDEYKCDGQNQIDVPVVVLVNQYSASASEILAGAIKDYELGSLVGTTTFGKGIVQRVIDFKDGTAVKLTVSDYYTPNGNNIHGIGIEPDVEVEFDADAYAEDKTDNQLDKGIEVMESLLDK